MAAELGIGVRVWVGWAPNVDVRAGECRLHPAVILDGPQCVHPGDGRVPVFGRMTRVDYAANYWLVRSDAGVLAVCDERVLHPIDDGEDQTTRDEREPVEETV